NSVSSSVKKKSSRKKVLIFICKNYPIADQKVDGFCAKREDEGVYFSGTQKLRGCACGKCVKSANEKRGIYRSILSG
uniref:Uncharacterized protein n=1 Tax=Phlebotomus papatasi TaxID=29031 RepID=A0A1B0D6S9_PHLPP